MIMKHDVLLVMPVQQERDLAVLGGPQLSVVTFRKY